MKNYSFLKMGRPKSTAETWLPYLLQINSTSLWGCLIFSMAWYRLRDQTKGVLLVSWYSILIIKVGISILKPKASLFQKAYLQHWTTIYLWKIMAFETHLFTHLENLRSMMYRSIIFPSFRNMSAYHDKIITIWDQIISLEQHIVEKREIDSYRCYVLEV